MNNFTIIILTIGLVSLFSCQQREDPKNLLLAVQNQKINSLIKKNTELEEKISTPVDYKGDLIHYVFLDIKQKVSDKQYQFLVEEIQSLKSVKEVKDLKVGLHENMDDDRALENRDINFEMRFKNKKEYYAYQKSEDHMRVRETLAPYLAKPPLTYDYVVQ